MYESNGGDLGLNDRPTNHSFVQAKNERNHQSSIKETYGH